MAEIINEDDILEEAPEIINEADIVEDTVAPAKPAPEVPEVRKGYGARVSDAAAGFKDASFGDRLKAVPDVISTVGYGLLDSAANLVHGPIQGTLDALTPGKPVKTYRQYADDISINYQPQTQTGRAFLGTLGAITEPVVKPIADTATAVLGEDIAAGVGDMVDVAGTMVGGGAATKAGRAGIANTAKSVADDVGAIPGVAADAAKAGVKKGVGAAVGAAAGSAAGGLMTHPLGLSKYGSMVGGAYGALKGFQNADAITSLLGQLGPISGATIDSVKKWADDVKNGGNPKKPPIIENGPPGAMANAWEEQVRNSPEFKSDEALRKQQAEMDALATRKKAMDRMRRTVELKAKQKVEYGVPTAAEAAPLIPEALTNKPFHAVNEILNQTNSEFRAAGKKRMRQDENGNWEEVF